MYKKTGAPRNEVMAPMGSTMGERMLLDTRSPSSSKMAPHRAEPRPKGRPRGSGAGAAPMTREQELEREVRRLEAEVAYLKKSIALKAELRSRTGRRP